MATIGNLLGEGASAQVFEDADNAAAVIKRTMCAKTIELLRELQCRPQPGLPRVMRELAETADGAVWFQLERLYPVEAGSAVLQEAGGVLSKAYSTYSTEVEVAEQFAAGLYDRGMSQLAEAASFLARFLRKKGGALDLLCSANYMQDTMGNVVFADPVAAF